MSLSIVKSQNLAQYAGLLANPVFQNFLKSASKKSGGDSGKYDALFENLGKLSSLLGGTESADTDVTTSTSGTLTSENTGLSQTELLFLANRMKNQELGQIVDDLLSKAEQLEAMLDLSMIPPDELLEEFFGRLREIITDFDQEVRKQKSAEHAKKDREVIKLAPDANTKSGFQEGLKIVAGGG